MSVRGVTGLPHTPRTLDPPECVQNTYIYPRSRDLGSENACARVRTYICARARVIDHVHEASNSKKSQTKTVVS